jgi:hypothetical protein
MLIRKSPIRSRMRSWDGRTCVRRFGPSITRKDANNAVLVRDAKAGPASLHTPSDLTPNAVRDLSGALNILLADMFALYLKTKNFHWHMSGPHFRD